MSAFFSQVYPDRVELLTDGAVYDESGTLLAVAEKVYRFHNAPAAMTVRGTLSALKPFGETLDAIAAGLGGFDAMLSELPYVLENLKGDDLPAFEALLCGISEESGPINVYFASVAYDPSIQPFMQHFMPDSFGAGPGITQEDLAKAGLSVDAFKDGLAAHGADLMEIMRRKQGPNPIAPGLPPLYGIGGHVDLTVIRADAATTTRIREWDDPIGEKINPFRQDQEAVAA